MKLSILITAYRIEKYIEDCLKSVLAQEIDFRDCEILIGVDVSGDRTEELCLAYAAKYPDLIRVIVNPPDHVLTLNGHRTETLNFFNLLTQAKGEYLAVCDGDDAWTDPLKLARQISFLEENPDFVLTFTAAEHLDESGVKYKGRVPRPGKTVFEHKEMPIHARNSTRVFRNLGFSNLPGEFFEAPGIDVFLLVWLSRFGKIKYLDFVSAVYRKHGQGVWNGKNPFEQALYLFDTRYALLVICEPHVSARLTGVLMACLRRIRDRQEAPEHRVFFRARYEKVKQLLKTSKQTTRKYFLSYSFYQWVLEWDCGPGRIFSKKKVCRKSADEISWPP